MWRKKQNKMNIFRGTVGHFQWPAVYVLYILISYGLKSPNGAHKYPISSKLVSSEKIIKCSSFIVLPR